MYMALVILTCILLLHLDTGYGTGANGCEGTAMNLNNVNTLCNVSIRMLNFLLHE